MSHVSRTRKWVEEFVIARTLCPFARAPYEAGLVRICALDCTTTEELLSAFWREVELIEKAGAAEISNTILIIPAVTGSFDQYLDLFEMATDLLDLQGKAEVFQLASFHPLYQFEGTDEGDPTNYTNRSPDPLIHIIRVDEVERAIASHPDIDSVPIVNQALMRELGSEQLRDFLDDYRE